MFGTLANPLNYWAALAVLALAAIVGAIIWVCEKK